MALHSKRISPIIVNIYHSYIYICKYCNDSLKNTHFKAKIYYHGMYRYNYTKPIKKLVGDNWHGI